MTKSKKDMIRQFGKNHAEIDMYVPSVNLNITDVCLLKLL